MDQQQLREHLDRLIESLKRSDRRLLHARLQSLVSVFPFSEYEYILMFLLDSDAITFPDYEELRSNYIQANRYLNLFELAPRIFGAVWGENHLMDLDTRIQKPSRSLDPHYDGQYDLWVEGVRTEVKAGRAYNTQKRGPLVSKALRYGSREPFWMNFQQLKDGLCDVYVFLGVWTDRILYWVFSDDEVRDSPYRSHQHRGGIEYQIGITHRNISEFSRFEVDGIDVAEAIIEKGT